MSATWHCPLSFILFLSHNFCSVWVLQIPAIPSLAVFQLSGEQLGDVGEAVAHPEDVPAVRAQDGGEGIGDALNIQQENVVKGVLHVSQLAHQVAEAAPGSFLPKTMRPIQVCRTIQHQSSLS